MLTPDLLQAVAQTLGNWSQDETMSLPGSLPGSQAPMDVENASVASSSQDVSPTSFLYEYLAAF